MTQNNQTSFRAAATKTVEMGDAATAYVFFPAGDRAAMQFRAEDVLYESSDTGLYGGERHDTDYNTKTPDDCTYQAQQIISALNADAHPKAVVFVHEPHRFSFNAAAVADTLQKQTVRQAATPVQNARAQNTSQGVWSRLMQRFG